MSDSSKHLPAVESHFLGGGYRAVCSCGWQGEEQPTSLLAEIDCTEHIVEMEMPSA